MSRSTTEHVPSSLVTGVGRTVGHRRGDRAPAGRGRLGRGDDALDAVRRPDAVGPHDEDPGRVAAALAARGARTVAVQADLSDVGAPAEVLRRGRPPASGPSPRW